jgi:hypothetical protein
LVNEGGGAKEGELFVSAKTDSQEMVKADTVVHVSMGDEDVADFQDFPRGKGMKITHIEEEGPFLKHKLHIHPWVAERVMDGLWMKQGLHEQR